MTTVSFYKFVNKKSGTTIQKSSNRCLHLQLGLAFLAQLFSASRAHAEDQLDYGYEYYKEDGNRMTIETHSVYFEQKLTDSVTTKGELVYDGISGSTPTGMINASTGQPKYTQLQDIRRSGNIEFDCKLGLNTLSPGFAYSKESDYQSIGLSLNDAMEFNEKNTTLQYGISHNFDSVRVEQPNNYTGKTMTLWNDKSSTEVFIGISQLLSPKTTFNAAFTFGNDSGYLSDPYRLVGILPINQPPINFVQGYPENRPSHRNKEVLFTSLTHYYDSLNASLEGSYRLYHDSYGVVANTVGLTWHQWLGSHFIAEPFFRIYEQSAASFYTYGSRGSVYLTKYGTYAASDYASSDYRLSEFYSTDMGLLATAVINAHLHIFAGYHRYEMHGMDGGATPSAMYPKANVYTVGLSILW